MATIEFGPGLTDNFALRVWGGFASSGSTTDFSMVPIFSYSTGYPGWPGYRSEIRIYKGTVPTNFSSLTNLSGRNSDLLLTIVNSDYATGTTNFTQSSNFSTNPVLITSVYTAASASGTATWFRIVTFPYVNTELICHQIVGTVGLPGSGSDLEIANTNLVSGKFYRIVNLKISIPLPSTLTV